MESFNFFNTDKVIICPSLIGRTTCLSRLENTLNQVGQGHGKTLVYSGEAGVGKSRLVAETKLRAGSLVWQVLEGHCFESDCSFPYAPLVDLLRQFLTPLNPNDLSATLGSLGTDLVKILPELSARLPGLVTPPILAPETEKRRLFEALTQFFIHQAFSKPLLLVIEDVHWSDQASLEYFLYLARRLQTCPVLLVLTCRNEINSVMLDHLLNQLERERLANELSLTPFNLPEVEAMLNAIFELQRPLRSEFLTTLHELTGGNPFYIEEILKSMSSLAGQAFLQSGLSSDFLTQLNLPRSIQVAVQQRLTSLSVPAAEVLSIAAVLGRQFNFELMQQLTGLSEGALLELIKELISAQLLVELSVEKIAFRHALTRQAVYNQLLVRERRSLHQMVAETIEQLYASTLNLHLSELANHFYQAGNWPKTLLYARQMAEKSEELYAPQSVIEQSNRIIEATRQLGFPVSCRDYLLRGQAFEIAGHFESASADYEAARKDAAQTLDYPEELNAWLALGFLWAARDYKHSCNFYHQALELARRLNDPPRLARCLNRLGNLHTNLEQPLEALQLHQEAMALFEELNDRVGLAETFDLLGMASFMGGNFAQSAAFYSSAIKLFRELNNRQGLSSSLALQPLLCGSFHSPELPPAFYDLSKAEAAGQASRQSAHEINWRSGEALALFCLGFCLTYHGRYTRAFTYLTESLKIAEEIEHNQWLAAANCGLGMFYLDLLEYKTARSYLEQALNLSQHLNSPYWVHTSGGFLASLYLQSGQITLAEETLKAVMTPDTPAQTLGQRTAWQAQAELALTKGQFEEALTITNRLVSFNPVSTPDFPGKPVLPTLLQARILIALNRQQEAETILQTCKAAYEVQEVRPMIWRVNLALAGLYIKMKRHTAAAESVRSAQIIIDEIAAPLDNEALKAIFQRQVLSQIPVVPALSERQVAKKAWAGLSEREREVALLVAKGKSNREIAEVLVLNKRTVESYLDHIFSKLNLNSRLQLAAWVFERDRS